MTDTQITTAIIAIAVVAWLACGVAGVGILCAYFAKDFLGKAWREEVFAVRYYGPVLILIGPFTLVTALQLSNVGWLWPWSAKAKKEAGVES